ncbi:MAG: glycosyltransferase, partial [Chryseobacterium sp.]
MPRYSIIIPCYCDGLLAVEAIESCLSQTYEADEIIFVDDGSPDDSYKVVVQKFSEIDTVKCYRIEN